jgi:hypothetical protein
LSWDPALMRKYNATGHFRLLNQLRSELKSQPIVRPERQADETGRQGSPIRTVEVRPQGYQGGRSRRPLQVSAAEASSRASEANNGSSFRERLNAIDMR